MNLDSSVHRKSVSLFVKALCLVACALLSGCLNVKGEHYLARYGNSDSGSYVMTMETPMYLAAIANDPRLFASLERYSRPRTRHQDGQTTISDTSGQAGMEHFYDRYRCVPAPNQRGYSDCTFSYSSDDLTFPAWSVDWSVVVPAEMTVLESNHHRSTTNTGMRRLTWYFDGNRVNSFNIRFTVRTPNA